MQHNSRSTHVVACHDVAVYYLVVVVVVVVVVVGGVQTPVYNSIAISAVSSVISQDHNLRIPNV